ncbi:MAG: RsmD family RNA methyltransferase [Bacteroidia bacterium]
MRISGGNLKGRKVPDTKLHLRPTTDRAKQGIFNILHHRLDWSQCSALDLFSGTGSITYELASRGCKEVTSVDISSSNCNFIRSNCKHFGLNNIIIVRSDALSFIRSHNVPYDIIIADPPYDYTHFNLLPELIFQKNLLKENGYLVIEHSKRTLFKDIPHFIEQRAYGEVNFSIFQ